MSEDKLIGRREGQVGHLILQQSAKLNACALIASNAPLTIALAKASAREIGKPSAERDFAKLDAVTKACFNSQDYADGRRAFMEKRKPNFQGK